MSARSRVAIIGAGFGGLAVAHALAAAGIDDVVIFEREDGVGGTWRVNSYPGAACDVPSHLYSLSFAPNPAWSRSYASQPEILAYLENCYDRFDVRRKVRNSTAIVAAQWQADSGCWRLRDARGGIHEAAVLVAAVGMFHTPLLPDIAGMEDYTGTTFHSARWNHGHDITGRRVAVVGTGASAVQIVPAIAQQAARTLVFQRTPPWILPRKDEPYSDEQRQLFASRPDLARRHRDELYDMFEQTTSFLRGDPAAALLTETANSYRERKVPDPALRAQLQPDYPIGCKRTLVTSAFYPALQRDDVDLVTAPIACLTPTGIRTADGVDWPCDTIVWSTGFRATEYLYGIEVTGRTGRQLHREWAGVPRAYHGMAVPGFPNFFMLYGPNTNQGGNSIILILEAQAAFIADTLRAMDAAQAAAVEVTELAMQRYSAQLLAALDTTVWTDGCNSYFRTAAGDVVTQLPHTSRWYCQQMARFPAADFHLTRISGDTLCMTS
jgi:cation diffusion facilitator CzcD-associated flavoprotein CzcO